MKNLKFFNHLVTLCVIGLSFSPAWSQEKKNAAAPAIPNMEEAMKKWMEAIAPGEAHKMLTRFVGSWETATSIWMQGLSAPPTITKGTAEIKWALGGRYIQQETKGEMMGRPMSGIGFTGYDNINKKFVSFWIDDMSTSMYNSEGGFDQAGEVLTTYGKMDEPMTGEHDKNVKYVSRLVNPDKFIFEVHDLAIGEPNTRVVEVTYTRKK